MSECLSVCLIECLCVCLSKFLLMFVCLIWFVRLVDCLFVDMFDLLADCVCVLCVCLFDMFECCLLDC